MSIRPVPPLLVDFTKRAEGRPPAVYKDRGGRLTGGWGHLLTADEIAKYPEGTAIDDATAVNWLYADENTAALRLASVVQEPILLGLSDHQYAALLDFVFNVGANAKWTIWKLVNRKLLDQVPGQLLRFDKVTKANGTVVEVPGLLHRRQAEISLWNAPDLEAACAVAAACPMTDPSSYTRYAITPPVEAPPKPFDAASLTAKAGTTVGAVGAAAQQAQGILQPHADVAPIFHQALTIAIGVGVTCAFAGLVIHNMQAKAATQ